MDSDSAFQVLKGEIKTALKQLQADGSRGFLSGNYDDAKKLAERAEQLEGFLKNLNQMQREWQGLMTQTALPGMVASQREKINRAKPRTKTNAKYFRIPILRALMELGGNGKTSVVVDRVGEILADQLNEYDRDKLPSGHKLRWRNTAEWVRNRLKHEGLVSDQTPNGLWEITPAGIDYLRIQPD